MTRHLVPDALRQRFGARLRQDDPLAGQTSFRIGGPAELFLSARSQEDLVDAVVAADAAGLPWLVLGRGSNVLVDDEGIRGLVVRNDTGSFELDRETGIVRADSGVRLPTIGAQTARAGLAGAEFAVGIPGSLGGGVIMNAGAHGGCVGDVLTFADVLVAGERQRWVATQLGHAYRSSVLQERRDAIVLGAELHLQRCPPAEALARVQAYRQHRQDTQPTDPGAGSIFRNPESRSAGALIDRAGLKGTTRGGAVISPKHGNFIVNVGGATSADVRYLIELARETVWRQFGVLLRREVELLGPGGRLKLADADGDTSSAEG
jgi:UDP-N-acetylmuramate dehydrogenase